jgi:hypothetical protein
MEPLSAALLAQARAAAELMLREVDDELAADAAASAEQAAELVAQARSQGAEDGAAVLSLERARGRRVARAIVLRAQREAYDELRSRCRQEVSALYAAPAGAPLRSRLVQLVHRELGPDAEIHDHPDGGLIGVQRGRRVDLSVDALVDRAISALGARIEQLWAP